MATRLAIYHAAGVFKLPQNPFGKDVANLELFRALGKHGGFSRIDVLGLQLVTQQEVAESLLEEAFGAVPVGYSSVFDQGTAAAAGALLRGQPDLNTLAWMRRRAVGDRGYSPMGLVHTLAPPAMRQVIAEASVAPVHPWDAIICTSPVVRDAASSVVGNCRWGSPGWPSWA